MPPFLILSLSSLPPFFITFLHRMSIGTPRNWKVVPFLRTFLHLFPSGQAANVPALVATPAGSSSGAIRSRAAEGLDRVPTPFSDSISGLGFAGRSARG